MTQAQADQITELRLKGAGYKSIGTVVGLSRDIVRNYCKSHGLPAERNFPLCPCSIIFCEKYPSPGISPLFNSAKIHAKGAIGLQPEGFWRFDSPALLGKDDTGTGRPDNGTQAERCRI